MNALQVGTSQRMRLQLYTRPFSTRQPRLVGSGRLVAAAAASGRPSARPCRQQQEQQQQPEQRQLLPQQQKQQQAASQLGAGLPAAAAFWLLADLPASAAELSGGPPASSYYVSLGLFLITLPGGVLQESMLFWRGVEEAFFIGPGVHWCVLTS